MFKVLETFDGYVDKIDDKNNIAYVTLYSQLNKDKIYGEYSATKLKKKGINEQDSFIVKTYKFLWWTGLHITYKPRKEITQEEALDIKRKIEERLGDYKMTDDY